MHALFPFCFYLDTFGILVSAYESKFLFQSHFLCRRRNREALGHMVSRAASSRVVEQDDTTRHSTFGSECRYGLFIKKEEDMDDTTTLSMLQFVFDLFLPDCYSILIAPFT
jgi:hypothetical protein